MRGDDVAHVHPCERRWRMMMLWLWPQGMHGVVMVCEVMMDGGCGHRPFIVMLITGHN